VTHDKVILHPSSRLPSAGRRQGLLQGRPLPFAEGTRGGASSDRGLTTSDFFHGGVSADGSLQARNTADRLRARHLAPRKGMAFSSREVGGETTEGVRPRPGLPPEPTGPLLEGEGDTASLETRSPSFGGRRRPWTRRPAVLLSFQGTGQSFYPPPREWGGWRSAQWCERERVGACRARPRDQTINRATRSWAFRSRAARRPCGDGLGTAAGRTGPASPSRCRSAAAPPPAAP